MDPIAKASRGWCIAIRAGMGRVPRPLKLAYICFKRNVLILHNSPLLQALAPGYIPRAEEIHRQRRSANGAEIKHLKRLDSIVAIAIISISYVATASQLETTDSFAVVGQP
jgi:hypothetical protein